MSNETEYRYVARGTIIKIGGIPFRLEEDAVVSGHPNNFGIAAESVIFPILTSEPIKPRENAKSR